jgi:hypothetical protein
VSKLRVEFFEGRLFLPVGGKTRKITKAPARRAFASKQNHELSEQKGDLTGLSVD